MATAGETIYLIRRYEIIRYRSGFVDTTKVRTVRQIKGLHNCVTAMDSLARGVAARIGGSLRPDTGVAAHKIYLENTNKYSGESSRTIHYYVTSMEWDH